MATYIKIRLLLALAAIFVFVYMLDGLPCLGDANEDDAAAGGIRIFKNNCNAQTSSDKISIGPSLVVPKLLASELDKINIEDIFPSSLFEKVESIGRRHISDDDNKAKGRQYVVREGDTLWSIAADQLGSGSRYKEISKLNADVLDDEDDLTVGMQLSLPEQS